MDRQSRWLPGGGEPTHQNTKDSLLMVILEFRRSATPNSGLTCRLFPKQRDLHFPVQNARVGKEKADGFASASAVGSTRRHLVLPVPLGSSSLQAWGAASFPQKRSSGCLQPSGSSWPLGPPAHPPLVSALQLSPVQRQPQSHRFPHLTQFLGSSISAARPE